MPVCQKTRDRSWNSVNAPDTAVRNESATASVDDIPDDQHFYGKDSEDEVVNEEEREKQEEYDRQFHSDSIGNLMH